MEQILERVQKVVTEYNPTKPGGRAKSIRALLAAIVAVRKYIAERSEEDKGFAQRIARELDDVLCALPDFKELGDKQTQASRHTRRLAEEHFEEIETYLKKIVAEDDAGKKKMIHEWVNSHPVFGELKRLASTKSLPKRAYILLFRKSGDKLELITRKTAENAVISRFRAHEFTDEMRVNKAYQRVSVTGAAVINDQELVQVIGEVPPPRENQTQLQALLALSKEAVGRPAQQFIESNPVLKQLFDLSRRRKMPKDAYVLLFQMAEPEGENIYVADVYEDPSGKQTAPGEDEHEPDANVGEDADSSVEATDELGVDEHETGAVAEHAMSEDFDHDSVGEEDSELSSDAAHAPAEEETASDEPVADTVADADSIELEASAPAAADEVVSSEAGEADGEAAELSADVAAQSANQDSTVDKTGPAEGAHHKGGRGKERRPAVVVPPEGPINCQIVVRKTSDGKVITRFWSADFAVKHKLFDEFKEKPPVVGAAIVKRSDLVRVIGRVPVANENQNRFDALMHASRSAVEKPSMEFVADNEVLKGLHELAVKDFAHRDACVIVFVIGDHGRIEVASGEGVLPTMPLSEFRFAKSLHDKFIGRPPIVGASVIAPGAAPAHKRFGEGSDKPRDDRSKGRNSDMQRRDSQAPKPSVIAAFGRTPLKVSLLATQENFTRLGINVDASRLFEMERFPRSTRPMGRPGSNQNREGQGRGPREGQGRGPREGQGRGPREGQGRGPRETREPRGTHT